MKKTTKKATKTTKKKAVSLKLSIGNDVYESSADTILDALKAVHPKRYLGFGYIEITVGDRAASAIPIKLVPVRLQRVFEKPIEMELLAKRLSVLL